MKRRPEKIGIFGGSFDPFHTGHLAILKAAQRSFRFDRVYVVPAYRTPLRGALSAPVGARIRMARLALKGLRWAAVSDFEARRKRTSFTVDTLGYFRRRFGPEADIVFFTGNDIVKDFHRWKNTARLERLARFAAARRGGEPRRELPRVFAEFKMRSVSVSASKIRRTLALGRKAPAAWLAAPVAAYIRRRRLYARPALC